MTLPLLVAYGSKRGSTREVAEAIADTLKQRRTRGRAPSRRGHRGSDALRRRRPRRRAVLRTLARRRGSLPVEAPAGAVGAAGGDLRARPPDRRAAGSGRSRARSSTRRCIRFPRSSRDRSRYSEESSIRPSSAFRSAACRRATHATGTRSTRGPTRSGGRHERQRAHPAPGSRGAGARRREARATDRAVSGPPATRRSPRRRSRLLGGRTVLNVNSTAAGGGVAEMLQTLLAYGRGAGLDIRWLVIQGDADSSRSPSASTTASTAPQGTVARSVKPSGATTSRRCAATPTSCSHSSVPTTSS